MDIKSEIGIKNEPFEMTEENNDGNQIFIQVSGLEEFEERNEDTKTYVKGEVEVNEKFSNEDDENDPLQQISELDQSQRFTVEDCSVKNGESSTKSSNNTSRNEEEKLRRVSMRTYFDLISKSRQFSCPHCGLKFKRNCGLKRHILRHSKVKTLKCSECNFICNLKHELEDHMTKHSGMKLYKCSQCEFTCIRPSGLKNQQLSHGSTVLFNFFN